MDSPIDKPRLPGDDSPADAFPFFALKGTKRDWLLGAILIVAVILAYGPVRHAGFIWDDDYILTANPSIAGPLGFAEIWTRAAAEPAFAPLTRSTLWLEHRLWGFAPGPYHIVNVLLHGASAILLWRVLLGLDVRGAWLGAALWALHPVEVESVAWVAEMKNTESGFFFLLAILFLVRWLKSRQTVEKSALDRDYALMLLCSALAMLCKASTVILPVIVCLCAWWLEKRWRWRNLAVVIPIALMSAAVSLVSLLGQKEQMAAAAGLQLDRSWLLRAVTAGEATWFYLGKLFWPEPLSAIYPRWNVDLTQWYTYVPLVGVIVGMAVLWRWRNSWARGPFFAFGCFLTALLPVIGLAENTLFHYSWVYDHLQYLASMAPLALAGAGMASVIGGTRSAERWMAVGVAGVFLLGLALLTGQRASIYTSSKRLWTDTVAKNPKSWVAHYNLGDALATEGRAGAALPEFEEALNLNPPFAEAYHHIGLRLESAGRLDEAISSYREGLAMAPNDGDARGDLGKALLKKGDIDGSISSFREAIQARPDDDSLEIDLGVALFQKGQLDEAIASYRKGLAMNPNVASSHFNLGVALAEKHQLSEAMTEFEKAVTLDPNDAETHFKLGNVYLDEKEFDKAIAEYRTAFQLEPGLLKAHNNLGIALAQSGRIEEAIAEFTLVVQVDPNFAKAQKNLDLAKAAAEKLRPHPLTR
jgi:Flp pilus assembly protein TadD